MKKIIYIIGMISALLFTSIANAEVKIAVVDVVSILQKMPQREAVRKSLDNEFSAKIESLKKEEKKATDANNRLRKDGLTLSATEKNKLSITVSNFEEKAQKFSADYRKRESEEVQKLLSEIQKAVDEIVAAEHYDLILKAEAILYAANAVNISEKVLQKVNK